MNDDLKRALDQIFPGDPVPMTDDDICWVQREYRPSVPEPKLGIYRAAPAPAPPPVVERPKDPVIPILSTRAHLLESPANAELWLTEARELEDDIAHARPTSVSHVTRLMLEAIPVVARLCE